MVRFCCCAEKFFFFCWLWEFLFLAIISSSSVGKFVVHTVGTTNTVYTYM